MAEGLVYYGADGGSVQSFREHFRARWPGPESCVVTDLDVVLRVYGRDLGGALGRFVLMEWKYGDSTPATGGQTRTFGLIDELLRHADPEHLRYRGLYLVTYVEKPSFEVRTVATWDGTPVLTSPTLDEFDRYLHAQLGSTPRQDLGDRR
jgi:hypothetical protein